MQVKKHQLFEILLELSSNEKAYIKKFGYKNNKKEHPIFYLLDLIDKSLKKQTSTSIEEDVLKEKLQKKYPNQHYAKLKSRLSLLA